MDPQNRHVRSGPFPTTMESMGSSAISRPNASATPAVPSEVLLFNWPLVQNGWRSLVHVLATGLIVALAYYLSASLAMTLLTGLVLVLATWRFWIPMRYRLTAEGIGQFGFGRRRLIPWPSIVRYEVLQNGVMLHFGRGESLLARLSTIYLDWGNDREHVLAMVDFFTRRDRSPSARGSSRIQHAAIR